MSIVAAFAVPHPPLIIPAVGHGREREIQATIDAYREVGRRIAGLSPQTIVISSPHATMYLDYIHVSPGSEATGSFAQFGAPDARFRVTYDTAFVHRLDAEARLRGLSAGTAGERDPSLDHATMVPLHFIRQAYREAGRTPDFQVVRIGLSGLSPAEHYRMGTLVQHVADELDRRVVYVASGDLSHKLTADGPYGYAAEGPQFDRKVCASFSSGDLLPLLTMDRGFAERAAECGLRSFQIMAGALDRRRITSELLSYEGPFGVGYGVAAFVPLVGADGAPMTDPARDLLSAYEAWHARDMADRRAAEDPLVSLARVALETYVREGRAIDPRDELAAGRLPKGLPDELLGTRAGCFVSLKKDGELRGCIGTTEPVRGCLADEICGNAVSAGTRDPRFSPVTASELPELVYDVDVLSEPERVETVDELDARRYGVIVWTTDGRRGLLLPDLDGVDSVDEQLRIAARKGGIDLRGDDWHLQRFEVVRHT